MSGKGRKSSLAVLLAVGMGWCLLRLAVVVVSLWVAGQLLLGHPFTMLDSLVLVAAYCLLSEAPRILRSLYACLYLAVRLLLHRRGGNGGKGDGRESQQGKVAGWWSQPPPIIQ